MESATSAAVNILLDAVCTIQGTSGGDDGVAAGRTLAGTPLTFRADRVEHEFNRVLEDHSSGQAAAEFNRLNKTPESITFFCKLEKKVNAALRALLLGNDGIVVGFAVTATGASIGSIGASGTFGITENVRAEYAGPSTLAFRIRQYGKVWDKSGA